jgi:hypothetical protein
MMWQSICGTMEEIACVEAKLVYLNPIFSKNVFASSEGSEVRPLLRL